MVMCKCDHNEVCPICLPKASERAERWTGCPSCASLKERVRELKEEAKRLAQINKVYEEQIAESAAVYAERDRLQEAVDEMPGWIAVIKAERMRQNAKWGEQNPVAQEARGCRSAKNDESLLERDCRREIMDDKQEKA